MTEYPLSTISSKKIKKSSNSLYEKSACQSTAPNLLNKAEYCHILNGERVFIELYYQGRVMETAYNEWIQFMGGTLYKRLNPKVSIFLTNSDSQQLSSILQRVRRICPNCRVISILWFQRCFQVKNKVGFEEFLLDVQSKTKNNESKQQQAEQKIDLRVLDEFLDNIAEDIDLEYREFFRQKRKYPFQYIGKNSLVQSDSILKAQEYDLGPNPNRKREKTARENPQKRRRRTSMRKNEEKVNQPIVEKKEESKQEEESFDKKIKTEEQTVEPCETKSEERKPQGISFNSMMEKYLNKREDSRTSQVTKDPESKSAHRNEQGGLGKYSNTQCISMVSDQTKLSLPLRQSKTKKVPLYSFSKKTTILHHRSEFKINSRQQSELLDLNNKLKSQTFNQLIVISDSKNLYAKIERVNHERKDQGELYLENISYNVYINFLGQSPPKHQAYYLFNPRRILDRPLYFALTCVSPNHPALVSYKLVDEVYELNKKIRLGVNSSKGQPLNLRCLKKMPFTINREELRDKKVIFLQSQLPVDVLQLVVASLQGQWVSQNEYLLGAKPDIVATNRNSLPDSSVLNLSEEQLWRRVFPFNEEGHP